MELFRTESHYIFVKDVLSLWWDRTTGAFSVKSAWDFSNIEDIECLGITEGILGKVEHTNIYEPRLIIIKESSPVGQICFQHTIYKIKSISFLNLGSTNVDLELPVCTKHGSFTSQPKSVKTPVGRLIENSAFLNKTLGVVKSAGNTIKNSTQQAASQVKLSVSKTKRDPKLADRVDKRLTDELHKIFDDSDSFYYSRTIDITSSLQRQNDCEEKLKEELGDEKSKTDIKKWWKFADDRFFWNKHMLRDIIDLGSPDCDQWILPVIQGFVHLTQCAVDLPQSNQLNSLLQQPTNSTGQLCDDFFTLGIISRRSRYQAGTRYNRRGIEPGGKVANYVETEQIVSISCNGVVHCASFVQVRGSVPIFWSQPEAKFRPPLQIDRGEDETKLAFAKHFKEETATYGDVTIINLVEQQGRERIIWEQYGRHVRIYNSDKLTYVTFDFHEYCRGMRYENVSILINSLGDIIGDMKFCWSDDRGLICKQNGVFRVNCIDCLDRTNVVQTALAKTVLELQLFRLGVNSGGSHAIRSAFLTMWADNGDALSRQYAGTKALKGDYTRTGERKITGIMKDGVNSANRYISRLLLDDIKQFAIDIMQGVSPNMKAIESFENFWSTVDSICDDSGRLALMPVYFGGNLTREFAAAEILYGVGRYYLSTFKDATRQLAIDVMTGEWDARDDPERLERLEREAEADREVMAHTIKTLIDDAKKELLPEGTPALGAWGLIDADPYTQSCHEVDIDVILLLTWEKYYVAEYDEVSDTIVTVDTVPLVDLTLIQLGTFAQTTGHSLFQQKRCDACCMRLHYTVHGQSGYFHTFRSTSLRFFNNMTVPVNSKEEMQESLRSICESIQVARSVSNLKPVPFQENVRLERTRSRPNSDRHADGKSTSLMLTRLSSFPSLSTNVSDSVKSAGALSPTCSKFSRSKSFEQTTKREKKRDGTKALSNMSEQFSRLNRLGSSFQRNKPTLQLNFNTQKSKKIFTLGQNRSNPQKTYNKKGSYSDGMSSDYSSDDENRTNIFEPTLDNFENNQHYIGDLKTKQDNTEEVDLIENPLYSSKIETTNEDSIYLPNTELVLNELNKEAISTKTPVVSNKRNPFDSMTFSESENSNRSQTPERPFNLLIPQKLSHSSFEVNVTDESGGDIVDSGFHVRSNSQCDLTLNISQSQSESALKHLVSPVGASAKDMVMSPLSRIAKGVQNLGANLDPRKIKNPNAVRHVTEQQYEDQKKLVETWKGCNTRLIAL